MIFWPLCLWLNKQPQKPKAEPNYVPGPNPYLPARDQPKPSPDCVINEVAHGQETEDGW